MQRDLAVSLLLLTQHLLQETPKSQLEAVTYISMSMQWSLGCCSYAAWLDMMLKEHAQTHCATFWFQHSPSNLLFLRPSSCSIARWQSSTGTWPVTAQLHIGYSKIVSVQTVYKESMWSSIWSETVSTQTVQEEPMWSSIVLWARIVSPQFHETWQ